MKASLANWAGVLGRGTPSRSPQLLWPTWLCVLAPGALLGTMISGAIHVRLALGHWPAFGEGIPSPWWRLHEFMLGWTLVTATFVAAPVWLILLCFPLLRGGWKYHLRQSGFFLGQWALVGLWWWLDPGRLLNWLLD